jgi:ABC-type antimicrobial peptide transport system permease subunit
VLSHGVGIAAAGLAAGLAIALLAGKFIEPLLFETSARDPFVLGLALFVLLSVAVAACLFPALRATRVDPVIALRAE